MKQVIFNSRVNELIHGAFHHILNTEREAHRLGHFPLAL